MRLRKVLASKHGVVHLSWENSNMSLCLQFISTNSPNINKEVTCKNCLKIAKKENLIIE